MPEVADHPTAEQKHKDRIEGIKAGYDFFKHLTTLSTGSVLLLATLLEKFFKAPQWTGLIGSTFVFLVISLTSSLIAMFAIIGFLARSGKEEAWIDRFGAIGLSGGIGGFALGMASLIAFTLKNFYS